MSLNITYNFDGTIDEDTYNITASNETTEYEESQTHDTFNLNFVALISISVVVFLWLIMSILAYLDEQSLTQMEQSIRQRRNNNNNNTLFHGSPFHVTNNHNVFFFFLTANV